jgi:hypothetical protein
VIQTKTFAVETQKTFLVGIGVTEVEGQLHNKVVLLSAKIPCDFIQLFDKVQPCMKSQGILADNPTLLCNLLLLLITNKKLLVRSFLLVIE